MLDFNCLTLNAGVNRWHIAFAASALSENVPYSLLVEPNSAFGFSQVSCSLFSIGGSSLSSGGGDLVVGAV